MHRGQRRPGDYLRGAEKLHGLLEKLSATTRTVKPRATGLTIVLDKFQPIGIESLRAVADHVDYAKLGWGMSLVVDPKALAERIEAYHSHGINVLAGGTLLELAEHRGLYREALGALWEAGFDAVEISAGAKLIPLKRRLKMVEEAAAMGFRVFAEVGRKKPRLRMERSQLMEEIGAFIEHGDVFKVVIESRESGRDSCLYDEHGRLRRELFEAIVGRFPAEEIAFEAPLPGQQATLVRKLGPNVNLGNIPLHEAAALESLRRGLRGDTFAATATSALWIEGPPSMKFVYFVLESYGLLSAKDIAAITGLPQRTVYEALQALYSKGLVDYVTEKGQVKLWYTL